MTLDLLSALRAGLSDDPSTPRPAGVEIRQDLSPAGGLPVQPPAYEGRLEIHPRYLDGGDRPRDVIELDSVGSAANRLEEVLLDLHRSERYPLPVSDTTVEPQGGDPIVITTLETPHRIFDAWIRLSASPEDDGVAFEESEHGRELSLAHAGALDALLETSAHDLLLGVWDSHRKGPYGQLRIGRSLTTSLIGLDPVEQAQFAARRDPLNIGDGSDLPAGASRLSRQGLSSIPPQQKIPYRETGDDKRADGFHGGVAITAARYLGFLSFASLRRLSFARYDAVEVRTLLAALALYALELRAAAGWDLRARCALVPEGELRLALVGGDGTREAFTLGIGEAERLFRAAVDRVGVSDRSVHLKAGARLNGLVDRAVAAVAAKS
jgi:CRISPR-associated protein Csb1